MKYALIVLALVVVLCSASMATVAPNGPGAPAPVNLTVDKYVFAYFPVAGETGITYVYGASEANNKGAFNLSIPAGATSDSDTVNMVWGCNTAATITLSLDKGAGATALPGIWTMAFDGAGLTGTTQQFNTEPQDVGALLAVPVTLNVSGIGLNIPAGSYAGVLNITQAVAL